MFQLTRRAWLAAAASSAATACALRPTTVGGTLGSLDGTATAAQIRSGEVTAAQVVEAAIGRAQAVEPRLNFMVTELFERARGQVAAGAPAGPFGGVPFLVKDLDDIAGVPTSSGSRLNEGRPPPKATDETVRAMEAAGLVPLGKSTTPEYGLLATTEPLAGGPTRNPWDPARSSGGSSGGAAAAVAAGVVPIAHASDGGGSIRIPAAYCGVFGLKPSRGRLIGNNRTGPFDISVDGCVSRTVRDSAAFYAAMERTGDGQALPPIGLVSGPTKRKLRIGLLDRDARGKAPAPEVAEGVRVAAELCRNVGHAVESATWPINGEQLAQDFMNLWSLGAAGIIRGARRGLGRDPTDQELEPFTFALAARAAALKPEEIEAGGKRLVAAGQAYEGAFARYDVLLSPVMSIPPPELGWMGPMVPYPLLIERLMDVVGYTPINNISGGPAMSVPLHWTRGDLPVGAHFAAKIGDERTLLELAYQLEAAKPWAGRRPAVHA